MSTQNYIKNEQIYRVEFFFTEFISKIILENKKK